MRLCDRCPRRDMAALLRALGETATADKIEAEGCQWWWVVTMQQGEAGASKMEEGCGIDYLPRFLTEYGARIVESAKTVGKIHNETVQQLARIEGTLANAAAEALPGALRVALQALAAQQFGELQAAPEPAALPPADGGPPA